MLPKNATGKRAAPPEVAPITYEGVQYSVAYEGVGGPEASCAVLAHNIGTSELLWKTVIYRVRYDEKKETDVQDIRPRSIAIEGNDIVVTNERSEVFHLNRATGHKAIAEYELQGKQNLK